MLNITVKTLQNWDYDKKLIAFRNPNNKRANKLKKIISEVKND